MPASADVPPVDEFDALTATQAEVDARIREMTRDAYRRQGDAAVARVMADMDRRYPKDAAP